MPKKDPVLCQEIRDRISKWDKYWRLNRTQYYEWLEFVLGDQWKEDESKLFERYNKIPLSFNKLGVLMNHILGDQMSNTPNLQISPEENVPPEAVDIRAALIKSITINSDTRSVFQTAFFQSVVGGFGAFRIGTDWTSPRSFVQEIKFYEIDDPNLAYWDLAAISKCKTDGMYAGYRTRMSRKSFSSKWGKDIERQVGNSAINEDSAPALQDDESITVIDDYERVGKKVTIYELSDGSTVDSSEYKQLERQTIGDKKYLISNGMPVTVVQKRDTVEYAITHRQIAGDWILDETDFPSEQLPIVFVDQKSYRNKQGQQICRSFFRDVKDTQRFLNYLATQIAYILKISRWDQFIMARKNAASPDSQAQWRDPSVIRGALYYDETPAGSKPEQLRAPELSASLTQQYERTLMDLQSGTGIYNTQLGEMGNEVSGRAIDKRNIRGSKNTQLPRTALEIAITIAGEIVNEMIPKVYDTERDIMLNMPEREGKPVRLNEQADEYGMQINNDMSKGRYKIRLKPGPSYEGQKEEALDSMQLVLAADKSGQVFPMIADLYAENLPIDNNIEIRNRLRTLVPPDILKAGKTGEPLPPKPPQPSPEAIMAQLKQQELQHKMQQAEQESMLKMKEIELKQSELQRKAIETHQDMTMEWEKLQAEKEEKAAELQETILRYQAERERMGTDLQIAHSQNLIKILTHHPKNENRTTQH